MTVQVEVVNRTTLNGTIDGHNPLVVTFRIKGPQGWFRLTVVTVNWGRGYAPGEFHANVMNVLNKVGEREYVVILIQELDEADEAPERRVFMAEMEPGTTLIPEPPVPGRETIAVSPGVEVTHKRRTMTMDQGTKIGGPVGTGPRRFLVTCIAVIEGVRIGLGDQHPHRYSISDRHVVEARTRGEGITHRVLTALTRVCDVVIDGGDFNTPHYPLSVKGMKIAFHRGLDYVRYVMGTRGA
jgi:hypothetical protein